MTHNRFPLLVAAAVLPLVITWSTACSSGGDEDASPRAPGAMSPRIMETAEGSYSLVGVAQLASMLGQEDFFLVNVHVPYEGHIQGTDAFIPYDEMAADPSKLPADKTAKVVVYCRSGRMSAIAAEALVAAGYTDVVDVEGGVVAWLAAGYALLQSQ